MQRCFWPKKHFLLSHLKQSERSSNVPCVVTFIFIHMCNAFNIQRHPIFMTAIARFQLYQLHVSKRKIEKWPQGFINFEFGVLLPILSSSFSYMILPPRPFAMTKFDHIRFLQKRTFIFCFVWQCYEAKFFPQKSIPVVLHI